MLDSLACRSSEEEMKELKKESKDLQEKLSTARAEADQRKEEIKR